jgi:hypothetical protein
MVAGELVPIVEARLFHRDTLPCARGNSRDTVRLRQAGENLLRDEERDDIQRPRRAIDWTRRDESAVGAT